MNSIAISGIDTNLGRARTGGSVTLYRRFLMRYPQDDTFYSLGNALSAGNVDEAFRCAHTLKGLTEQLGIIALSVPAGRICELLRPRNTSALASVRVLYADLLPVYRRIVWEIGLL